METQSVNVISSKGASSLQISRERIIGSSIEQAKVQLLESAAQSTRLVRPYVSSHDVDTSYRMVVVDELSVKVGGRFFEGGAAS